MAERSESEVQDTVTRRPPATTPEARENQLIAKAYDRVEAQIEEGTASAQVLSHFLKLGSTREKLEQAKLAMDNELTAAKIEAMAAEQRIEALYSEALAAMSSYRGETTPESDDDFD